MTCVAPPPTFRLLDAYVGWEQASGCGLTGFDDPAGLRLAAIAPDGVDPGALLPWLPPPRLAFGGRPRTAWLVSEEDPPRLLRRDPCTGVWTPVWPAGCAPRWGAAVAVAVRGRRLAVADRGAGRVEVWNAAGGRLVVSIPLARPRAVALTPWGEILVAAADAPGVLRFGPGGDPRGVLPFPATAGVPERLAAGTREGCGIWLVTRRADGALSLFRASRYAPGFVPADIADITDLAGLAGSLPPTGLVAATAAGFCLADPGAGGVPVVRCFSWRGCPLVPGEVAPPPPPALEPCGELATRPLDSGIARCRWHRVRIDADQPPGTALELAVASSEDTDAATLHPADWQAVTGSVDFLVAQPPGRHLFLRLRLRGDGRATPVVRRIRLDFPRLTSLSLLPAVYREDPRAEEFTERFLSLFDAVVEDLDGLITRFPALLDGAAVDARVLPWLGSFLDLAFEPGWPAAQRREILAAVPRLYPLRGTVEGLVRAVELVFGVRPAIQELAAERRWGSLGRDGRLGAVRLFGRARARFRLGASALGGSPLRSFGDPGDDPLTAGAYRFRVLLPAGALATAEERARLARLIESQKPAHTLALVRFGRTGFVLGPGVAVGIDTALGPLAAPVLGAAGNVRLGRASVVWAGARGPRTGLGVGTAAVGIATFME